jgi:hypothetical protein
LFSAPRLCDRAVLFGAGFSLFGATITGAELGGLIGATVGTGFDNFIAPGAHITRKRLSGLRDGLDCCVL